MPEENVKLKIRVMRNLAVAQLKLRDFDAALDSFETITGAEPSTRDGFSIILCHCCLGHGPQQLKDAFSDLVNVELQVTFIYTRLVIPGRTSHIRYTLCVTTTRVVTVARRSGKCMVGAVV